MAPPPSLNYPIQEKNLIERFMQHLKDRTECFDDYFPCRKEGCDRAHVWNWLRLFVFHIHQKMDPTRVVGLLSLEAGLS